MFPLLLLLVSPSPVETTLNLYVSTTCDATLFECDAGQGVRLTGSLWRAEDASASFACTARYGDGASEPLLMHWHPPSMIASAEISHR